MSASFAIAIVLVRGHPEIQMSLAVFAAVLASSVVRLVTPGRAASA
jgi:hypothetical protein